MIKKIADPSAISEFFEKSNFQAINAFLNQFLLNIKINFKKPIMHNILSSFQLKNAKKKCLDRNGMCGNLLTDLSRAFDCLPHFILIVKVHA